MLLEDLLALPVGTRVLGQIERTTTIPGSVALLGDGSHYIRWEDGYSTIRLGMVRQFDEYIAAHTQLNPARYGHVECRVDNSNKTNGRGVRSHTAA